MLSICNKFYESGLYALREVTTSEQTNTERANKLARLEYLLSEVVTTSRQHGYQLPHIECNLHKTSFINRCLFNFR